MGGGSFNTRGKEKKKKRGGGGFLRPARTSGIRKFFSREEGKGLFFFEIEREGEGGRMRKKGKRKTKNRTPHGGRKKLPHRKRGEFSLKKKKGPRTPKKGKTLRGKGRGSLLRLSVEREKSTLKGKGV